MKLTVDRLKEVLEYDPETGLFHWRTRQSFRIHQGQIAGVIDRRLGYVKISVDYVRYLGHRLAWFYMRGQWPADQVDHINMLRSDNRWNNLREADNRMNNENRRTAKMSSLLGVLGVSRSNSKFRARIFVMGKEIHLGVFDTAELANAAYVDAKRKFHSGCTL